MPAPARRSARAAAALQLLLAAVPLGRAAAQAARAAPDTASAAPRFTRADTLRGTVGPARAWWDVTFYDLRLRVRPADSTVAGSNAVTYRVLAPAAPAAPALPNGPLGRAPNDPPGELQLDLQAPLVLDSVVQDGRPLAVRREGNAYFAAVAAPQRPGELRTAVAHYHGRPRVARRAPWDGGVVWARDSAGAPWVATAVQGLGASAFWPNKDTQADEPDSQRVAVTVPDPLIAVSNGRLRRVTPNGDGTTTYEWFVTSPINNYDVALNAGSYAHFADLYRGEGGTLTLDFWPLAAHADAARRQFQQVRPMLACFEHWFGPYPWYADGYKLVESPHLGMEHQSAVAYGNHYQNGYRGRDLSGTGLGLGWDYILVHESGHEWWGNSITTRDIADMWVHEAFTMYAEALYVECREGRAAGARYAAGVRRGVQNDRPVIGPYGVNAEGSGDMYYKGANMLHTVRQLVGDDARWRGVLRGLQATFRHQTVTGAAVQAYMSQAAGLDLSRVFAQYLTTTRLPTLEYAVRGRRLRYRWADVVPGFAMPVRVAFAAGNSAVLRPTARWQTIRRRPGPAGVPALRVDENYYVLTRDVDAPPAAPSARAAATQ